MVEVPVAEDGSEVADERNSVSRQPLERRLRPVDLGEAAAVDELDGRGQLVGERRGVASAVADSAAMSSTSGITPAASL